MVLSHLSFKICLFLSFSFFFRFDDRERFMRLLLIFSLTSINHFFCFDQVSAL